VRANLELTLLGGDRLGDIRDRSCARAAQRETSPCPTHSRLSLLPRLPRRELVEPPSPDIPVGADLRSSSETHNIAGLDLLPSRTLSLPDHAAGRVLYLLHIGVDDKLASGDHRAGELRRHRPAAEARDQEHRRDDDRRGLPPQHAASSGESVTLMTRAIQARSQRADLLPGP